MSLKAIFRRSVSKRETFSILGIDLNKGERRASFGRMCHHCLCLPPSFPSATHVASNIYLAFCFVGPVRCLTETWNPFFSLRRSNVFSFTSNPTLNEARPVPFAKRYSTSEVATGPNTRTTSRYFLSILNVGTGRG